MNPKKPKKTSERKEKLIADIENAMKNPDFVKAVREFIRLTT